MKTIYIKGLIIIGKTLYKKLNEKEGNTKVGRIWTLKNINDNSVTLHGSNGYIDDGILYVQTVQDEIVLVLLPHLERWIYIDHSIDMPIPRDTLVSFVVVKKSALETLELLK